MKKTILCQKRPRFRTINLLCTVGLFIASCGAPAPEAAPSPEPEPNPDAAVVVANGEDLYKPFTWLSDSDCVHTSGEKLQRSLGVKVNIPEKDIASHNFVKGVGDTLYLELITTNAASHYHPANAKSISSGTRSLLLTANDLVQKDAVELLNSKGDLPVLVFLMVNESTDPAFVRMGRKLKGKGWVTRNF